MLPSYRSPTAIQINSLYLLESKEKSTILRNLQVGLVSEWARVMPPTKNNSKNYLKNQKAVDKCRSRFHNEVKLGRMIGGLGWTLGIVEQFLGKPCYTIPCGAVPKNDEPFGRIIHDYSHPSAKEGSVNSALINTSVEYISFVDRARRLSTVDWYMKVDMKNGYRQLGVHPSE